MGYNTAILILNDQLNELARDSNAGKELAGAVLEASATGRTVWMPLTGGQVLPSVHADLTQVVLIGGNRIRCVMSSFSDEEDEILREWAAERGYELRRKKGPSP